MAIPIEIQRTLNELAHQFSRQFLSQAKAVLNQRKYKASGATANSIKVTVQPATGTQAPLIQLNYDDAGDYIAKKKLIYTKQPPAKELLDSVQSGKFRMRSIPGYASGSTPGISLEKQQQRVAFAMARAKFQHQKHRRKRWKKDALSVLLRQMNIKLTELWAEQTSQIIAKSLST